MFKRWFLILAFGALATLSAITGADAGCCGSCGCGGFAAPMVQQQYPQPYYVQPPQPVYQQPVYMPQPVYAPQQVYQPVVQQQPYAPPCGGGRPFLGRLLDPSDSSCAPIAPVPVYIVNQGPVYSGPNVAVAPAPYSYSYGNTQPYPYAPSSYYSGEYSGGPYADPIRHRAYHYRRFDRPGVYRYSRVYQPHAYRYGPHILRRRD